MILPAKPEVFSREMIKPSSPTPSQKRIHKLSFFDQLAPPIYIPLLFFYPNNQDLIVTPFSSKTQLFKTSLSQALSQYYPLAGKIRDSLTVDCNDEGVAFIQARMDSKLAKIIQLSPVDETLKLCFPDGLCFKDTTLSSPLTVQVTEFNCGGMAVALCLSHKILDMSSICSFVNYWAALASNSAVEDVEFDLAELYPPVNLPATKTVDPVNVKCASQRFVFDGSSIGKLKSLVGKEVENPTRVEVVLAILHSSAVSAIRSNSSSNSSSLKNIERDRNFETEMHVAADLRSRVAPPIPSSSIGNMASIFGVVTPKGTETEVVSFVGKFKEAKTEHFETCAARARGEDTSTFVVETTKRFREEERDGGDEIRYVFGCSSWCRFPFYDADFGWGKPVWVTPTACGVKGIVTMMDAKDGDGIEAFLCLEEQDMAVFEADEKLLAFCKINPGVVW